MPAACPEFVPYERLSTRMLRPGSCACWTTQSIAAITCDTSAPPSAVATLRLTIRASGAMPRYSLSWPAISPAMNVPCPYVS